MSGGIGGFEPFLDDAEFTFGQLEPADAGETGMSLELETSTGVSHVDAVAINEFAGETVVLGFEWATLDAEALREKPSDKGVALADVEQEQIDAAAAEQMCMLTAIVPWQDVIEVRLADEMTSLFEGSGDGA